MQNEIHLIFNPGRGEVDIRSVTAVRGDRVGALPAPVRKGYSFEGWFTFPEGADIPADGFGGRVSSEHIVDDRLSDDTVLFAHWKKLSRKARRKTSLRNQKRALIALAVAVVLLVGALIFVNYIVDIYTYTDVDGVEYTLKKRNGKYALFLDGELCDVNHEGFYQTKNGTLLDVDESTGDYEIYAVVHTAQTEELGHNRRVLMFKQLTYDMSSTKDESKVIKEIRLKNEYGEMTLVRGDSNRFFVEGHEGLLLDDELFATLASACGYTISTHRLADPVKNSDGTIDLSEYGLVSELRTKTVYPEGTGTESGNLSDMAGEGVTVEYMYEPTKYTITTMTGEEYTVTVGDMTLTGSGYYAMYESRDTVYVLNSANITEGMMIPVEALVVPTIVYTSSNQYYDVSDFTYRSHIDYDEMYLGLLSELLEVSREDLTNATDEELAQYEKKYDEIISNMPDDEFSKMYDAALAKNSTVVTAFSYIPLSKRENQLYSTLPFQMSSKYMAGYLPDSNNIYSVLQNLNTMTIDKVVKLGPSDDDLEKYGLSSPAHIISYYLNTSEGSVYNHVEISANTDGVYYAYSPDYDMIVEFAEHQAPFLEWEDVDWYSREFFGFNIAHITEIIVESKDTTVHFLLDNSASTKVDKNGVPTIGTDKLTVYANGKKLDYSIYVTKPSGSSAKETAVYNFKRFFAYSLATASLEGMAELSDDEIQAFLESPDSECQLKLTVIGNDGDYIARDENGKPVRESNSVCNVYRFYQYSERKSFMTVEALDSPSSASDPSQAQGRFYVSRSFCDKIIADAVRVMTGKEVPLDSKY